MLYGYKLYEMGEEENLSKISDKLWKVSRILIKFREPNDASITTASLIDLSYLHELIVSVKSLVNRGGIDNVGIPNLLLRLRRLVEPLASEK